MTEPQESAGFSTTPSGNGHLTAQEAAEMAEHLALLARLGLPLEQGLRAMAAEVPSRRLRGALLETAQGLERGQPLDQALRQSSHCLPDYMRGLILAGIRTGRLGQVLDEYVHHCHFSQELRRRAWMALAYPLILGVMALGMVLFFEFVLVPQLSQVYEDFDITLPLLTVGMLWISRGTVWLVVGGCLALSVLWPALRAGLSPVLRRRLVCRVPLVGPVWRFAATAELSNFAALLLENSLPLPAALDLAGQAVGDADLADACDKVRSEIEQGGRLCESPTCRQRFPAGLAQMLRWGEARSDLPAALRSAANAFAGRARLQSDLVRVAAPMLSLTIIITVLSYLIIAAFLPLISLIETLS